MLQTMNTEFFLNPPVLIALALVLVVVLVPLLKLIAPHLGLLDHPCERKAHEGIIPLIGGIVIFPVFMAMAVLGGVQLSDYGALFAAIMILLVTGAIDDRRHLPALVKFALQFIAAFLVVVPGGAVLQDLGDLFGLGVFDLGAAAIPFSVVAMVLLINAINLMDGVDGLAGGTAFIILGWFLFAAITLRAEAEVFLIMLLMACIAGFLVYNMRTPWRAKASIFMGDAGSMCLGLMIGWFAITLSPTENPVLEPMAVAWVLAVPIWDECAQFYRRVQEGRHPFSPDRGHFHHHFERAGFTPGATSLCIHGLVFLFGAIGVLGVAWGVPLFVLTSVWIVGIVLHMAASKNLEHYTALLKKLSQR